ncbi:MAG: TonB family protein [Gemmatimonadota bacterium]
MQPRVSRGSRMEDRFAGRAEQFRASYPRILAAGLAASVAVHVGAGLLLELGEIPLFPRPVLAPMVMVVDVLPPAPPDAPPAVRIPPPVAPVLRPGTPEVAPLETPDAPPEPVWIPHDLAPRLVNVAEVRTALEEGYPPALPAEASESAVVLWLFVDESGRVTKLRLRESSGWSALDRLAQEVAPAMRFRPALNRGRTVAVWVAQQIRFEPGEPTASRSPGSTGGRG